MLLGLVLLYLGLQFRFVESFVLNEPTSQFISQRFGSAQSQASFAMARTFMPRASVSSRSVTPPQWIGWALLATGAVLVLHALAMPKPSG